VYPSERTPRATVEGSGGAGGSEGKSEAVAGDGLRDGGTRGDASAGNCDPTSGAARARRGGTMASGWVADDGSAEIETSRARSAPSGTVPAAVGAPQCQILVGADIRNTVGNGGSARVHWEKNLSREEEGGGEWEEVDIRGRGGEGVVGDGGGELHVARNEVEANDSGDALNGEVCGVHGTPADVDGASSIEVQIHRAAHSASGNPEAIIRANSEVRTLGSAGHDLKCVINQHVGDIAWD